MGEPSLGTPPSERPLEDRLDSWKEIAAYLNRDVTTVQRWEKREGMPVHRHLHDRMGSVYASRAELDAWTRSRNLRGAQENGNDALPPDPPAPAAARRHRPFLPDGLSSCRWSGGSRAGDRHRPLASEDGVLLAKSHRRRAISDGHGLRWNGTGRCVSRDGHFVAFLSDRDGQMDVWVTQVGSGEFHNLTHGSVPELVNPSIRTLGFSPDGSLVTFWVRKPGGSRGDDIGIWAVPTLGGEPRPYLEGVAEFDWSHDGSRLAYHTPGPGDPLFVSEAAGDRRIGPSSLRPPGSTLTFPCGRLTRHSFTSSRVPSRTNWTSGASLQPAELLNGSRRTMGA